MQKREWFRVHDNNPTGLIEFGAARRAVIAATVVAALWALFFWATYTQGSL